MFSVPALQYDYDALEGVISKEIMELHHNKHHQTYVDKLNAAIGKYPELQSKSVEDLLRELDQVPEDVRTAVRNNGGGHYNHCLFWLWLSPNGGGEPEGPLKDAIINKYGSFQAFIDKFDEKAVGLFGSGWVWLQPDMEIVTTPNQDSLLSSGGAEPVLGLDVWEHAYYLDYKNHRDEYIKQWWKVVNWPVAQERYERLSSK